MFVKVCGITTEEDALLAVALGADAVGFVFAPSSRNISARKARDLANRLPSEVVTVGVFRNELPARVVEVVSECGLKAAQLHGEESARDTAWVARRVPATIKAFTPGHPGLQRLDDYHADVVLIDGLRPGSGEIFDWALAEGVPLSGHRVMLAGGLDPTNVADGIRRVRPWGVDVSTGVERKPGRKDPAKMRAFINAAKTALSRADSAKHAPAPKRPHPFAWELSR